jgi:hypothetical protein
VSVSHGVGHEIRATQYFGALRERVATDFVFGAMLWLRWFAVASAVTALPYHLAQEEVLWPPVLWALVFTALNFYQIARIYAEPRPVVLSADEQTLYDMGFQTLRPRQFLSFVVTGEWKDARPGDQVLADGGAFQRFAFPRCTH